MTTRAEPFDEFLERLNGEPDDLDEGPGAPGRTELTRMRAFLSDRYAGARPRRSRVDRLGHVYDYFPIEEQPASLRYKLKPAAPPPDGPLGHVGLQLHGRTPEYEGLVPIRRITLGELARFESLDRFLHKHGARRTSLLRSGDAFAPGTQASTHRWADAYQSVENLGASATLNVWAPTLADGQTFSLSQIWCVAMGPAGKQTVELGWHVNPSVTGHDQPALFCYWTRDGYSQTGAYNGQDGAFHFNSSSTVLGVAISDVSVTDGEQSELFCTVKLYQDAWWLYVGGDQQDNIVGYYASDLYGSGPLASGAAEVDFGGEVCGGPPFAPMGSGALAGAGYGKAAYQRNLGVYAADGSSLTSLALQSGPQDAQDYSITAQSSDDWGSYIYFGGPGGD